MAAMSHRIRNENNNENEARSMQMAATHELKVLRHPDVAAMGAAAAEVVVAQLREAIEARGQARLMLAAAPSQLSSLRAIAASGLDMSPVTCFHMDDYLGLAPDAPQGFGNWLDKNFFAHVAGSPTFHRMRTTAEPQECADEYERLMGDEPFDVTMCGLGVNAHLAFNDPPADFNDTAGARVVVLEQASRQQQVDEGHFPTLNDVPERAVTVTIPRLLNAGTVVCSVPGAAKRQAVADTLSRAVDPMVPGTALKLHPRALLYVESESDPR